MGNAGDSGAERPRIDFAALADRLLQRAEYFVSQWLPGGKRKGHEWQAASTAKGGPGDSLSVNLNTGAWAHFAPKESGRDLISLYAYLFHGGSQLQAAKDLLEQFGEAPSQKRPLALPPAPPPAEKPKGGWQVITPVPAWAAKPSFHHFSRRPEDIELVAEYRLGDALYGYVVRFRTSDGGKDPIPHTWCRDEGDGAGTQRWHWKTWPEPRPLFVPAATFNNAKPVLVVEGEKCAVAAHKVLHEHMDVVSWPGGVKAVLKADWSWIAGRRVVLWPDCDAARVRLTKDEEAACVDPATKPILPEAQQPGMAAMVALAEHLRDAQRCDVSICRIPAPGAVTPGWDVADAIAQGWDQDRLLALISEARPFGVQLPAADRPQRPAGAGGGRGGAAGQPEAPSARHWQDFLIRGKYGPLAIRENIVMALDGIPEQQVDGIEEVAGLVAFNEFSNNIVKTAPTPWGTPAGTWWEEDELLMGDYLCRHHDLPSMARGTLEEAVRMVAFRHRFHPVRTSLEGLRGTWDKVPRLNTWLRQTCLEEDEWDDNEPLQQYLAKVGAWTIMAMCARVLKPGCKFDYMLILEGTQGLGKSTLVHALGGEYAADTPLNLGDKDSFQNLQGIWVYEMGELDSLSKAEITRTKQFISSVTDRFRATFDRRPKDYPRQCIFVGTTNEQHYLTDPTGNRRFWPVRVTRHIDQDWLRANRSQLLAEALHRLDAGERYYPTPEESRELFEPQQQERAVENAIESAINRYLHDENQQMVTGREKGTMVKEITLLELLNRIGIGIEKLGPGRYHEKQAAAALRKLGWQEGRSSAPGRPRVYRRPAQRSVSSTSYASSPTEQEADEAIPF